MGNSGLTNTYADDINVQFLSKYYNRNPFNSFK